MNATNHGIRGPLTHTVLALDNLHILFSSRSATSLVDICSRLLVGSEVIKVGSPRVNSATPSNAVSRESLNVPYLNNGVELSAQAYYYYYYYYYCAKRSFRPVVKKN